MRTLLFLLLGVFALMVLINFLAPVTRRCRRRLEEYEATRPPSSVVVDGSEAEHPLDAQAPVESPAEPPSVEAEARSRLRVREGVLGLLFVPVLVTFAVLNAGILSEAFALLLDRAGGSIGTIDVGGLQLEITDLHLYGFALSSASILLGVAFAASCEAGSAWRWFVLCAGVVPLVLLEMWLSSQRGYLLAIDGGAHPLVPPLTLSVYNALMGGVFAVTNMVAGFYVVHALAVPIVAGLVSCVVSGLRRLARLIGFIRSQFSWQPEPGRPWLLARALAYVDEAWIDPLRGLDREAGRLLTRGRSQREAEHA